MNIKTILLAVLGIAAFILIGWFVNDARAQDRSQPVIIQESNDVEDLYLRLKVDWEDKEDITGNASLACYDFSGEKKVACYNEHAYFNKKQISGKALDVFVEFKRRHGVE